jgi:hypothetical protein
VPGTYAKPHPEMPCQFIELGSPRQLAALVARLTRLPPYFLRTDPLGTIEAELTVTLLAVLERARLFHAFGTAAPRHDRRADLREGFDSSE